MNYELFQHNKKKIFLVDMTKELNPFFSELVQRTIEKQLSLGKHIALIVNKKGYSQGLICQSCGHIPQCKKCSVSIGYHKTLGGDIIGLCHICKTQYTFPKTCPDCSSSKIKEFGMGTQKIAEHLQKEYHIDPIIIESETVNSPNKIAKILESLASQRSIKSIKSPTGGPSDLSTGQASLKTLGTIVIGTSLLCTPIQCHPFDVVIFLNADLGLHIPDYTSAEKNFYFLYEAFTKHSTKDFIVQTFNPDHWSIRHACKMDPQGFFQEESIFRQQYGYPPFTELCVLLYKNEIEQSMFAKVDTLYKELLYLKEKYGLQEIEITSTPPLIYKMFGKYRYNIIIKGPQVKQFMDIVYPKLKLASKGFKVDRMAESIV